jgi:hypothetical protein
VPVFKPHRRKASISNRATALIVVTLGAVGACVRKAAPTTPPASTRSHVNSGALADTLEREAANFAEYVESCIEALGPLPVVDCEAVDEVYVWGLDSQGRLVRFTDEDRPGLSKDFVKGDECLNPATAGPVGFRCAPFERFGRIAAPDGSGAEWGVTCRQGELDPKRKGGRVDAYESVGLIGYDRRSGKACFFDTVRRPGGLRRATMPVIGSEVQGDPSRVWMNLGEMTETPATNCVRCHASFPFAQPRYIHHREVARAYGATPFLFGGQKEMESYFSGASGRIVPKNFDMTDRGHRYEVVRADLFESYGRGSWTPAWLSSPEVKACTGCHRLGAGFFAARVALQSFDKCDMEDPWKTLCSGLDRRAMSSPRLRDHTDLYHSVLRDLSPKHELALRFLHEKCYLSEDQKDCR